MDLFYDDILAEFPNALLLAEGGQKVVFAVDQPIYGNAVLKVGLCSSDRALERIRREVEVLRDIDSEFYPRNYEFQILDGHRFLILEERIDGLPLSEHLADFVSIESATELIKELVNGLCVLWERRIIHRDIKPQNILITPSRRPKIIDLGIARLLDLESLTRTLALRGPCTPAYASPEQLENRKHQINHRSDQYSLGIVYAQLLLEGRHPFDPSVVGTGESFVENILTGSWAKHEFEGDQFAPVRPILFTMLGHEPYQRYRTPEDLHSALKALLRSEQSG